MNMTKTLRIFALAFSLGLGSFVAPGLIDEAVAQSSRQEEKKRQAEEEADRRVAEEKRLEVSDLNNDVSPRTIREKHSELRRRWGLSIPSLDGGGGLWGGEIYTTH